MWRRSKEQGSVSTQPITQPAPRSREIPGLGRVTAKEIPAEQKLDFWINNRQQIIDISTAAFKGYKYAPDAYLLASYFLKPDKIAIVLKSDTGKIVGFNCSRPEPDYPETAYDAYSAIHPDYQGLGLYDDLRITLDDTLRAKGFHYKMADIRVKHGLADKLEKSYQGSIISKRNYHDFEAKEDMRVLIIRL